MVLANFVDRLIGQVRSPHHLSKCVNMIPERRSAFSLDNSWPTEDREDHKAKQNPPHQKMRNDVTQRGLSNPGPAIVIVGVGITDFNPTPSAFEEHHTASGIA